MQNEGVGGRLVRIVSRGVWECGYGRREGGRPMRSGQLQFSNSDSGLGKTGPTPRLIAGKSGGKGGAAQQQQQQGPRGKQGQVRHSACPNGSTLAFTHSNSLSCSRARRSSRSRSRSDSHGGHARARPCGSGEHCMRGCGRCEAIRYLSGRSGWKVRSCFHPLLPSQERR